MVSHYLHLFRGVSIHNRFYVCHISYSYPVISSSTLLSFLVAGGYIAYLHLQINVKDISELLHINYCSLVTYHYTKFTIIDSHSYTLGCEFDFQLGDSNWKGIVNSMPI